MSQQNVTFNTIDSNIRFGKHHRYKNLFIFRYVSFHTGLLNSLLIIIDYEFYIFSLLISYSVKTVPVSLTIVANCLVCVVFVFEQNVFDNVFPCVQLY